MTVIDIHTHVWPDTVAEKAIPALVASAKEPVTPFYDGTVSGLIAQMDLSGVDVSVIQPVATKPSQVVPINDWAASCAGPRILPFGAMHPALDDPSEEIARMASLGLKGFKLHPEYQEFDPYDPGLDAMWAATIEHDMIVLFHAGADICFPSVRGTAESFARLMDTWPWLKIVLAHLGGYQQWTEVAEHIQGRDVWLDTAFTLGHMPDDEFVELVRAHGPHRVLFGSDGPWTDPAAEIAYLRRLGFSAHELDGILGNNAKRLLRL